MHTHTHIYIYIYIYRCLCVCVNIYIYIYILICTSICIYIYIYIYMGVCVLMNVYLYIYGCVWVCVSCKPYIFKKNKMSRLKFATEYVIWIESCGIVFISAMIQSLTCSVITREGSFDAALRNYIRLSALKAAFNLESEVWWCLAWFLLLVQDLLSGYTVKLTQLYTKRYWRNMLYLIWELQLIKQLYLCKITPCVTQRSLLRHFFLRRMFLL